MNELYVVDDTQSQQQKTEFLRELLEKAKEIEED
jgi:hypothetical protein